MHVQGLDDSQNHFKYQGISFYKYICDACWKLCVLSVPVPTMVKIDKRERGKSP